MYFKGTALDESMPKAKQMSPEKIKPQQRKQTNQILTKCKIKSAIHKISQEKHKEYRIKHIIYRVEEEEKEEREINNHQTVYNSIISELSQMVRQ